MMVCYSLIMVVIAVTCTKPHNEVPKYFTSRKLHTNTGSSEFLIEWSLCCGERWAAQINPGPENLQFLHIIVAGFRSAGAERCYSRLNVQCRLLCVKSVLVDGTFSLYI